MRVERKSSSLRGLFVRFVNGVVYETRETNMRRDVIETQRFAATIGNAMTIC